MKNASRWTTSHGVLLNLWWSRLGFHLATSLSPSAPFSAMRNAGLISVAAMQERGLEYSNHMPRGPIDTYPIIILC